MNNQELSLQLEKVQSGPSLAKESDNNSNGESADIYFISNC